MWIDRNQSLVQVWIFPHKHLGIKRHGDKEGAHTTLDRHEEDIADLQADEKGERHDEGSERAVVVVGGFREFQIEIREKAAYVGDKDGAHGQDGVDETL